MTPQLWSQQPQYGIEIPDITKIIEPAAEVLVEAQFPSVAFNYTQMSPSASWRIKHNLNFHPNVTVVDSAGTIVEGEIQYVDQNNLVLNFQSAFSGNAYLS
jgi:hypothetical protein